MPSRFDTRFRERALPALEREFNQKFDLISADGKELSFDCFIDLDEIPSGEGFSDVQGKVKVNAAKFNARITDPGAWNKARVHGEIFDVYAKEPDQYGRVVLSIQRKYEEQKHSNIYDIHGTQIPFASE